MTRDDQMTEALKRQAAHGQAAHYVDRRGWTDEQWCDDAARLMHDLDGAVTSLVNGHVLALIRERNRLKAALGGDRYEPDQCPSMAFLERDSDGATVIYQCYKPIGHDDVHKNGVGSDAGRWTDEGARRSMEWVLKHAAG